MSPPRAIVGVAATVALGGGAVVLFVTSNAVGGFGLLAGGALLVAAFQAMGQEVVDGRQESDAIDDLTAERREELLRGTSLFLREARSRVSIRPARSFVGAFAADVNGVRLGFVPAIVCDQATETEDDGFVAFVHDGRRWRGPGLPCPGTPDDAVARAERCVSPIDLA